MARGEFARMTPEQRSECGRKGAMASKEAKRKKKYMKEVLDVLLDMPLKKGKHNDVEDIRNFAAIKGKNLNVQEAIMIAQVQKALKGDTNAIQFIRDTIGQKQIENINLSAGVPIVIKDDMGEDESKDDAE